MMDKLIAPSLTGGCTVRLATDQRPFELHPLDVGNCEVGEGYEDTGLTPWDVHSILVRHKAAPAWVSCAERLPTEADADCCGEVWWWIWGFDGEYEAMRDKWDEPEDAHYWMPTGLVRPEPPNDIQEDSPQ